jgi:nucleoside-diphosphate-sugar epimerase
MNRHTQIETEDQPMQQHHLVIGAGPVGSGVATALAAQGTPATIVTRRGTDPGHPLITAVRADAADADALSRLAVGAMAIHNCVNPPYHMWATDWPPISKAMMTAAERSGAVLVMMDNLYAFGPGSTMPMCEGDPTNATGPKGATRRAMEMEMLDAHAAGRLRATFARASDFFGPGVRGSAMGERVVPRVLAGKKVSVLGSADIPHSASYMPDVVRTLITIATDERAWGRPWHVPSTTVSQAELVGALARAAGTTVKVGTVPRLAVSALGLFVPLMRELKETWYQFAEPWVLDATLTEQTFGLSATPLDEAAAATIAWWKARGADR